MEPSPRPGCTFFVLKDKKDPYSWGQARLSLVLGKYVLNEWVVCRPSQVKGLSVNTGIHVCVVSR